MTRSGDGLAPVARDLGRDHPWLAGALAVSAGLHLVMGLLVPKAAAQIPRRAVRPPTEVIDIEPPAPPPPKPAAETPPAPFPTAAKAPVHRIAPVLAQAAQVITRTPASSEPLDFTNDIVTGTGASFAGGTTASTGTSRTVVREAGLPAPVAALGGTGSGDNLSRPASMAGESTWKCPFPIDANGIDDAFVQLRVFVDAAGKALDATVMTDPGHGFGAEALRCAIGTPWNPALDREGKPVRATAIVRVHFTR